VGNFRVGVDIGGTFTDTVSVDETGAIGYVKVPSTPPAFYEGLVDGVKGLERPLGDMTHLAHGTTVGINAIVTRHGARTGVVTTKGFRDTIAIRRADREEMFDLWWQPAEPLVPRRFCFEVDERVAYDGSIVTPLDEDEVRALGRRIGRIGLEAVAIVFINSPMNAVHEQRARELLAEELGPEVYLSASSDILPEILESERTATTAINAYIGPLMSDYVGRLQSELASAGYRGDITIGTSAGGVATPDLVRRVPARTVESGPAAGVMAARETSRLAGFENVVTFDMGGTSLDLGIVAGGEVRRTNEYVVEWGMPVRFPCVDVFSIGAGGGSIAWIDAGGALRNGPQSAGARPGPACYGQGGTEPTNTDAQVTLGRMAPESFLGGEMTIRPELSREAIARGVGEPLGLDVEAASAAVLAIANNNMLQSLRLATVERGYDPRDFALFALGGAGPLYAAEVARAGDIPTVIVPRYPGLTSALGLLMVDVRHDVSHSILLPQSQVSTERLNEVFAELEERVGGMLAGEGIDRDRMVMQREVDLRYFGQSEGFTVPVPSGVIDEAARERIIDGFLDQQRKEFGYTMPDTFASVELVTARVGGIGQVSKVSLEELAGGGSAADARKGERPVSFDGEWVATAVLARDALGAGAEFDGPAIVEQTDSTTVVPPGARARVDAWGNIIIDVVA
jgi:N-methylhydantoinase A